MESGKEKNMIFDVDVSEDELMKRYPEAFETLFIDRTMSKGGERHNIFWATSNYEALGGGYGYNDQILPENIIGKHKSVIVPRAKKSRETQRERIRDKAEVFTPSWICNVQNNLIDNAWFGRENVFNCEKDDHTWNAGTDKITFPEGKTWQDYVRDTRLEITCGEAPYLVSRYDTTTGTFIPIVKRIGLLDRKLRVVGENTETKEEWLTWATKAYQSIYGYEWQGDNLLLARENLFVTFIECYQDRFGDEPYIEKINEIAEIISWNLWQMDGLKGVVPNSCKDEYVGLFGEITPDPCPGCLTDNIKQHNGAKCQIMDWETKTPTLFINLIENGH